MKVNELKCTDLSIGNWIKAKGALSIIIGKVIEINMVHVVIENDDGYTGLPLSILEPIELTEEVLLKIGFKKNKYDWWEYFPDRENKISILMTDNYTIIEYANLFHCPEDVTEVNYGSTLEFPRMIYIHELQNLYYLLTNEELKVEL